MHHGADHRSEYGKRPRDPAVCPLGHHRRLYDRRLQGRGRARGGRRHLRGRAHGERPPGHREPRLQPLQAHLHRPHPGGHPEPRHGVRDREGDPHDSRCGRPRRHGHGRLLQVHEEPHREGPDLRPRHGRHPQLHPLRHRRLLGHHGLQRGHDRRHRHERPPVHRPHLRRGEHAGHEPADLRHAHGRGVPLLHRLRHLHHPAGQDRVLRPQRHGHPGGHGHRTAPP